MTFDSFFKEEYEISIVELGLSDPFTVELDTITANKIVKFSSLNKSVKKGQT